MAGGRPKLASSERRDRSVRVRLSADEFNALTSFAEAHGMTTSETLRRLVRHASGLGPSFQGEAARGITANVAQLRKAGVNLNQITRALNSGRNPGFEHLKGGVERLGRLVAEQIDMLEAMCVKARARAVSRVSRDV